MIDADIVSPSRPTLRMSYREIIWPVTAEQLTIDNPRRALLLPPQIQEGGVLGKALASACQSTILWGETSGSLTL